jgi:hypothetical protein
MNINNMYLYPRKISYVPFSVPSTHLTGLYFSINSVAFHGLFDSGADWVVIPRFVARDAKIDLTYRKIGVVHRFGDTFTRYRAPLGVVDGPTVVTTVAVGDFLPALVPPQIYLPHWSIEFTAHGVRFLPKRVGAIPYSPYPNSWGIPFNAPILDFSITGENTKFPAVLDTGSYESASISRDTASQIGIERFPAGKSIVEPLAHDINKYDSGAGLHYLPLTLGGSELSFVVPTQVWSNHANVIPAELLLTQGLRIILSERSIDITKERGMVMK